MSVTAIAALTFGAARFTDWFATTNQLSALTFDNAGPPLLMCMAYLVGFYLFFSLPALHFVMRVGVNPETGCATYAMTVAGIGFVGISLIILLGSGNPTLLALLASLLGGHALFFCLPLMFARQAGLSLWTRRSAIQWDESAPSWTPEKLEDVSESKSGTSTKSASGTKSAHGATSTFSTDSSSGGQENDSANQPSSHPLDD